MGLYHHEHFILCKLCLTKYPVAAEFKNFEGDLFYHRGKKIFKESCAVI